MEMQSNLNSNFLIETNNPIKKYQILDKIGRGKYGKVYRAKMKTNEGSSQLQYAIKKMQFLTSGEEGIPYYILREISALKKLKHENIVTLNEIIYQRQMIYMVMEYAQLDLSNFISQYGGQKISIFQIKNIMGQLLTGLAFMHSNYICHRDLKPENILISPEGNFIYFQIIFLIGFIKISDFGLSRYMNPQAKQNYTTEVVTQVYRAPELLLNIEEYNYAVDIWSIGCIFVELISQFPLFVAETPLQTLELIFQFKILFILRFFKQNYWNA